MESITTAYVKIWGDVVGAVAWDGKKGYATFEYEPNFLKQGLELSPIHMTLAEGRNGERFAFPNIDKHTFNGLPGLLASALPDRFGNQIIDSWLTRNGRDPKSFNPVERLCYIGIRGMGALEFDPQINPTSLNKSVSVEIENLMELVQEVMTERSKVDVRIDGPDKEKSQALLDILRVGTSAGGALPKAIIAMNDNGHLISGQSAVTPPGYNHWILKFDGVSEEDPNSFGKPWGMGQVEYAYSLMAKEAGINMTECRLLNENGRSHFMTRRFDRVLGEKIHVLSLACMSHFGWNPVGSYGYEDAFYTMREIGLDYPKQEQQYRRMIFNAVTTNLDDHTKNISYTMDKNGLWDLSPAYDVNFSYSSEDLLGDRHKMTINGKQKNFIVDDFLAVAENMEINHPQEILENILETVLEWPKFAKEAGVQESMTKAIGDTHSTKT